MVNGFQETKEIRDTNLHQNISNETIKEIMFQSVSHRDEVEGGLDKDAKWMENMRQSRE